MNDCPAEIQDALAAAGLRPRSAICISTVQSREIHRAVWRIELADGILKARSVEDSATAEALEQMRRELPSAFARVLARHGNVLLEEWIEGDALLRPSMERAEEAGRLLAQVHRQEAVMGTSIRRTDSVSDHRNRALECLEDLTNRHISAGEARALADEVQRTMPAFALYGLVHFDYCIENMVVDRENRLRVVDNERVHVDALGFDVGRAWYRSALPAATWQAFYSAYVAAAPTQDSPEVVRFWRIVAVARAAALRLRVWPDRADEALRLLRALAAEVSR